MILLTNWTSLEPLIDRCVDNKELTKDPDKFSTVRGKTSLKEQKYSKSEAYKKIIQATTDHLIIHSLCNYEYRIFQCDNVDHYKGCTYWVKQTIIDDPDDPVNIFEYILQYVGVHMPISIEKSNSNEKSVHLIAIPDVIYHNQLQDKNTKSISTTSNSTKVKTKIDSTLKQKK